MQVGGVGVHLDKEMKRGISKVILLSVIAKKKTYPYAMLKTLKTIRLMHGYKAFGDLSKSDIYNLLAALEKEGFIKSKAVLHGKKIQKMYTITQRGRRVVMNKDRIFKNLIGELTKLIKDEFIV